MDNVHIVKIFHPLCNIVGNTDAETWRKMVLLHGTVETAPGNVLRDHPQLRVGDEGPVELYNVGAVELLQNGGLAVELFTACLVDRFKLI